MSRSGSDGHLFTSATEVAGLLQAMRTGGKSGLWEYLRLALGSDRATRDLVARAVNSLATTTNFLDPERAARSVAIIEGCDFAGKTGLSVARELGLVRSRFYRERRNALARLGQLIEQQLAEVAGFRASVSLSLSEMEIAEADLADRSGHPQQAIAKLQSILDRGVDRSNRVAIMGRLVVLYAKQGKSEIADRLLAETRRIIPAAESGDRAKVDLAEALLASSLDDQRRLEEIARRLTLYVPAAASNEQLEASAIALAELARLQVARSDSTSALATLERIDALLALHSQPPLEIRVVLLNLRAQMHIAFPASIGIARAEARTAFHLASRRGLVREAWQALHTLVDNHLGVLDLPSVLAYAQHLLRAAEQVGEPRPIAMASLMLAATQAQMHGVDQARRRIESCQVLVFGRTAIERELLQAYVLGLSRDYSSALDIVKQARRSAETLGFPDLIGVGFHYESLLLEWSGSRRGVREAAAHAVEVLESGTSPYHLVAVYDRVYHLTGDRQFRSRARSLASTFNVEGSVLQTLTPSASATTDATFGALLTRRQAEIAHLICAGRTNREIGREVGISESTAAHHVEAILRRLGLRARWQLLGTYVL